MAYLKSTLIARPGNQNLGDAWDTAKGYASSAIDFFGAGLKAQGAQEALAAQLAAQNAALAARGGGGGGGGISTTTLLVGGAVLAGVLVFAMRRK
jgi:hypothetical protein